MTSKILLLAGEGILPVLVRKNAAKRYSVVAVSCRLLHFHRDLAPEYVLERFSLEELSTILEKERPHALCLVGKVPKAYVFTPDVSAIFAHCGDLKDRHVVVELIRLLEHSFGITVLSPFEFLKEWVTQEGVLFGPPPTEEEWRDVEYGWRIARFLADEEIGQTVVVKRGTVVALEGAEGTDAAIRRGLSLAPGGIVVKVARSTQDFLVDVPAIGAETVRLVGEGKGRLIALESGRTLLVDREAVQEFAERFGVTVLGITR